MLVCVAFDRTDLSNDLLSISARHSIALAGQISFRTADWLGAIATKFSFSQLSAKEQLSLVWSGLTTIAQNRLLGRTGFPI